MVSHRAWSTDYSCSEYSQTLTQNVTKFIKGEKPDNIVNLAEGH